MGLVDAVLSENIDYPSLSDKISEIILIIVLFLSKISLYEGFLLFLPQNKEEI